MLLLLFSRFRRQAATVPSLGKLLLRLEFFLLALVCMGVVYGVSEHASAFNSLWLVWQTVTTVGYGDMPPKTIVGMSGVMLTGIIAILLLPYLLSAFLEYREDRIMRRRTGMDDNPQKNGTLLICCRSAADLSLLIAELRCADPAEPVCVVDDRLDELPSGTARLPGVHFVKGPILADETYRQAGIGDCRRVLVFPHDSDRAASDATTESVVRIVHRLAPPETRVVYLLVDPSNARLFNDVPSAAVYQDFAIYAALQELRNRGSAEVFTDLMSNSGGANPTTFRPVKLIGWTWGRLARAALAVSGDSRLHANPLALIRAHDPNPCPALDEKIGDGDLLSLIVHRDFDYAAFESAVETQGGESAAGK